VFDVLFQYIPSMRDSIMRRSDVLVEADQLEERGVAPGQVLLTRLQDQAQRGRLLTSQDQTNIRVLSEGLGMKPTRIISVDMERAYMTQPLGLYYTRITVPHKILGTPQVSEHWMSNPIELAEVFEITSANCLGIPAMRQTEFISLHYAARGCIADALDMLIRLKLETCRILELRNLGIQKRHLPAIKLRMNWPRLEKVVLL
jgi:hypothetical protein